MKLLKEIIIVSLNSLKANKLKSFLTILGIVVGIFSIIVITTVISMLQTSIENGLGSLGQNTFQIQKNAINFGGSRRHRKEIRQRKDIEYSHFLSFKKKYKGNYVVAAEEWNNAKVAQYKNEKTDPNVSIVGITSGAQDNNNWIIEEGRAINANDVERSERVIVLGKDVAKRIFKNNINPVGKFIRFDGKKLRVIGVYEPKGDIFGQSQDNFVVIPITTFAGFYGKHFRSINITVKVVNEKEYADAIEKAVSVFRIVRKIPPAEEDDFSIFSNESLISTFNTATQGVKIGAIVIGMIALLAAGIGIMNIMLVSVTERTKEIGIRKSIGAKKKDILYQFLTEAIVLSQIGGLLGIFLGVILGNVVGSFMKATAVVPMDWIFIGVGMCTLVGVGFGTYPAYKAANLDPIEALRYE